MAKSLWLNCNKKRKGGEKIAKNRGKEWTEKEDKKLTKFHEEGLTSREISKKMGRTEGGIRGRIAKLGLSDPGKRAWDDIEKLKKKRFRKPHSWEIKNRILMGLLLVEDIKLSELAEKVNVTARCVQNWVYEGRTPSKENQKKIAEILEVQTHILFREK